MGFCAAATPEMGEYSVEVRSESFYLHGEGNFVRIGDKPCPSECDAEGKHTHGDWDYVKQRHAIGISEQGETRQGVVEILLEDIPKIRAALDQVERVQAGEKR